LVVTLALGAVVLIAWLLKPIVVRRLNVNDGAEAGAEPEAGGPPGTPWTATWDNAERRVETGPAAEDMSARPGATAGEIVAEEEVAAEAEKATIEATPDAAAQPETTEAGRPLPDTAVSVPEVTRQEEDAIDVVGITLRVRELLGYANAGQVLRGFALYSESYLQRFRAETGLSDEEFAATLGSVPAPPPESRATLAAVTDVEVLPDGRVTALISFDGSEAPPPPERFVFVRVGDRWLIDDIAMAG